MQAAGMLLMLAQHRLPVHRSPFPLQVPAVPATQFESGAQHLEPVQIEPEALQEAAVPAVHCVGRVRWVPGLTQHLVPVQSPMFFSHSLPWPSVQTAGFLFTPTQHCVPVQLIGGLHEEECPSTQVASGTQHDFPVHCMPVPLQELLYPLVHFVGWSLGSLPPLTQHFFPVQCAPEPVQSLA